MNSSYIVFYIYVQLNVKDKQTRLNSHPRKGYLTSVFTNKSMKTGRNKVIKFT
ncbi:hypothetical protein Lalb_Chr03g0026701 [Lupinus albus]|uniref:Uncharacterized protein n=1 Tax=Lupinus albus TaxID=3870 RepID=A0A6A4QPF4_LUPAL|nr:hypothetical protein Lalb_Chr03g0026701 [Lupinus albus]